MCKYQLQNVVNELMSKVITLTKTRWYRWQCLQRQVDEIQRQEFINNFFFLKSIIWNVFLLSSWSNLTINNAYYGFETETQLNKNSNLFSLAL